MLIYRYIVQKWIIIPVKLENMSYYPICQLSGDIYYFTRLLRVCLDHTELLENRALVLQGYFFMSMLFQNDVFAGGMVSEGGWGECLRFKLIVWDVKEVRIIWIDRVRREGG